MMWNRYLVWLLMMMAVMMSSVVVWAGNPNETYYNEQTKLATKDEAAKMLESANRCELWPEMVKLIADNVKILYLHRYARAMRCSGWSTNESLSCQATERKTLPVKVHSIHGWKKVLVDVHKSCAFQCAQKKEYCNNLQIFENCKCKCTNTYDQKHCGQQADARWDEKKCECNCTNDIIDCTTGYIFDKTVCKCIKLHKR